MKTTVTIKSGEFKTPQNLPTSKGKTGRIYEGKTCDRCGRFYIPTGSKQKFCKPDCKPLTQTEQAELDATLKQIEANKNKSVI